MRVGTKPENFLERVALASGLVPTPLVDAFLGLGVGHCVLAATKLGVFEALSDGEKPAAEIAEAIGGHPTGTETLLNALNGFGFIRRRDGRFRNARVTERWLLRSSKRSIRDLVLFVEDLGKRMGSIEDAVLSGKLGDFHREDQLAEFWERYMRGLSTMARTLSRSITKKVELANAPKRLLDVGGGHGQFSIGFCRRYQSLRAEVLDLPDAAVFGRRIVDEEGFSDRVTYRDGDFRHVDWGAEYDVVLIFNVLHNCTTEDASLAVSKAFDALRPGGKLVILDAEHREHRGNLSGSAGFSELFFFVLGGTRAHPEEAMRGWIAAAGFDEIRTKRLFGFPEVLISGVKPGA